MKQLVSTIELDQEMIQKIHDEFPNIEYKYVHKKALTDEDIEFVEILNTYGAHIHHIDVNQFKNLKWLNVMSAGVNSLPLDQLKHVHITNARGIHKHPMSEFTLSLILSYYKNLNKFHEDQNNHTWDKDANAKELYGQVAHILGTGSIGARIAEVLKVFNVKTVGYNTSGKSVEHFDETYSIEERESRVHEADIVISILPSTDETKNMLDVEFFKAMKDSAIFINIGRGDIMTDDTLIEVLNKKYIAHMMLDVFNKEPLSENSILYDFKNLTITPHASSNTSKYKERAFELLFENLHYIDDFNKMRNIINHESGY